MNKYYFVGSGIASLAGAAYLIRDGEALGREITIFEAAEDFGGALDAHGSPQTGYFMSGSRMFEHYYNATLDLLSFIASISDPFLSIKEETERFEKDAEWHNKARLVNREGAIVDFHEMRFSEKDRLELFALMARSERSLDSVRITDCFDEHFFKTNFGFEAVTSLLLRVGTAQLNSEDTFCGSSIISRRLIPKRASSERATTSTKRLPSRLSTGCAARVWNFDWARS